MSKVSSNYYQISYPTFFWLIFLFIVDKNFSYTWQQTWHYWLLNLGKTNKFLIPQSLIVDCFSLIFLSSFYFVDPEIRALQMCKSYQNRATDLLPSTSCSGPTRVSHNVYPLIYSLILFAFAWISAGMVTWQWFCLFYVIPQFFFA